MPTWQSPTAFELNHRTPGGPPHRQFPQPQPDPTAPSPLGSPGYMAKYAEEMIRLGWTAEEYDEEFSIAIRITITRLRAT